MTGPRVWWAIEHKRADLWIGVFWCWRWEPRWYHANRLHIWICLVPCVPIHLVVGWRLRKEENDETKSVHRVPG